MKPFKNFLYESVTYNKGFKNSSIKNVHKEISDYLISKIIKNTSIKLILGMEKMNSKQQGMVEYDPTNNKYTININKNLGIPSFVGYIAHELTHIQQIQKGDLKFVDGIVYWKGDKTDVNVDQMGVYDKDYNNRPWEKSANLAGSMWLKDVKKQFKNLEIDLGDGAMIKVF